MPKLIQRAVIHEDPIHATVPFVAVAGTGVILDPTDITRFIRANGTRAHMLARDSVTEIPMLEHIADYSVDYLTPILVNGTGTGRRVTRAEMEGPDLLQLSGTGLISGATAANTALTWINGKIGAITSGHETAGWLRAQMTPQEGGGVRVLVEFVA